MTLILILITVLVVYKNAKKDFQIATTVLQKNAILAKKVSILIIQMYA
jgi:hypothetical protein